MARLDGRLDGKVAVITGAASGIGEGAARLFVEEGARVIIGDIQEEKARALASELGPSTRAVIADVRDDAAVAGLVATAVHDFGALDVMFNNAGVGMIEGPIADASEETFDFVTAINLKGVWLGIKHAARQMRAQGRGGSIISTASVAGLHGFERQAIYGMTKAGVISLTRSAAAEGGPHGVRANCICPGGIITALSAPFPRAEEIMRDRFSAIHPIGREGTPRDIAQAALWLAGDESTLVTGQAIAVDGGWSTVDARWQTLLGQMNPARLSGEAPDQTPADTD
ncbi:MAG: NAD(P)-dependent dehydrogenase, short-chain alcohol dehydrogenase family [Chloroflexi bacterium]|nr:MAG: NAD(P)-dependent dehydrogenase, short-chain alcohol dehydrogenase family [Chloroflexota bacterium]